MLDMVSVIEVDIYFFMVSCMKGQRVEMYFIPVFVSLCSQSFSDSRQHMA